MSVGFLSRNLQGHWFTLEITFSCCDHWRSIPQRLGKNYEAFTSLEAHQGWTSINCFSGWSQRSLQLIFKCLQWFLLLMEEIRLTSWYGESTTLYRVLPISTGAGFLPSTVVVPWKKHPVLIFDGQTAPCIFCKAFFPIRDDVSQLLGNYHKEERKFAYFQVDVS